MNKPLSTLLILSLSHFLIFSLSACGNKEQKSDAWEAPEHEVVTRQLPDLKLTDSIKNGGHTYVYSILRTPSDSLPSVEDDLEDRFKDNTIRLTLRRDGKEYFDKTFTKSTFAPSIEKDFFCNSILDGIRFIRVEPGQGLVFSFAVSYPDSDMSVPFLMTIADNGSFTYVKDENLDHEEGDSVFFDEDGV